MNMSGEEAQMRMQRDSQGESRQVHRTVQCSVYRRLAEGFARAFGRWQQSIRVSTRSSRLSVIERTTLGPKQSLILIEAEGIHLLVAISSESTPAFFPLSQLQRPRLMDGPSLRKRTLSGNRRALAASDVRLGRISW